MVEHWLPKPRVAGSSPVYRSKGVMVAMSMVAISLLEWITRTRDPINKESAACCAGSLQAKRQADYESRLPLNRKAPQRCFLLYKWTRARDPINKEKRCLQRGVLCKQSGKPITSPVYYSTESALMGAFMFFSLKYFIFLLTRPYGHTLTLYSLANKSYDYE